MSQLIAMRSRIKAIETIYKVTHAMRLISMSSHTRLAAHAHELARYQNTLDTLWQRVVSTQPSTAPILQGTRNLIIAIGSDKGLCGMFSQNIAQETMQLLTPNADIICIGKRLMHAFDAQKISHIQDYAGLHSNTIGTYADQLVRFIIDHADTYGSLSIVSNWPVSFFVRQVRTTQILPHITQPTADAPAHEPYVWYEPQDEVIARLTQQRLQSAIYTAHSAFMFAMIIKFDITHIVRQQWRNYCGPFNKCPGVLLIQILIKPCNNKLIERLYTI